MAKVSIAVPIIDSPRTAFFLSRLLKSLDEQTFKDYEIVITKEGAMAHNHNAAAFASKGELVKYMQMDDYFAHPDALKNIVEAFTPEDNWLVSACLHDYQGTVGSPHYPSWNDEMYIGNNTLGGYSTLTVRRSSLLLSDELFTWIVDCDLYWRYYKLHGPPRLLNDLGIVVDVGEHRLTSTLSDELKMREVNTLKQRYA